MPGDQERQTPSNPLHGKPEDFFNAVFLGGLGYATVHEVLGSVKELPATPKDILSAIAGLAIAAMVLKNPEGSNRQQR